MVPWVHKCPWGPLYVCPSPSQKLDLSQTHRPHTEHPIEAGISCIYAMHVRHPKNDKDNLYYRTQTHIHDFLVAECNLHGGIAVVQRVLPRVQQEHKTQLPGRVARQRFFYRHKVLQRLWHLAASDGQMARVKKITDPVVIAETRLTIAPGVITNNRKLTKNK